MKTISVALTTYNGESFLQQQLDSIVAQTRLPDELVVADDKSTDSTWAILSQFAKTAPFPVQLHRNETQLGWRANFMHVLGMCNSDLVALCDQDDVWHPGKLAMAAAALEQPDVVLFFHNAWLIDRNGVRIGPANLFALPAYNPPLSVQSFFSPYGFSMVCSRMLLQFSDLWKHSSDSNQPNACAPHDQWLFFLATILGAIVYSDDRLTEYRQHGLNAVGPPAPAGLLPRLQRQGQYWLTNPARNYNRLAAAARHRAAILTEIQDRVVGKWGRRAAEGKHHYVRLASCLERRARLYEQGTVRDRISLLAELSRDGAYRRAGNWGIHRSALAKDAVLGLLLQPFLLEPGSGTL